MPVMEISKLVLEKYRKLELEVGMKGAVELRGRNGVGKSSVIEALRWVLGQRVANSDGEVRVELKSGLKLGRIGKKYEIGGLEVRRSEYLEQLRSEFKGAPAMLITPFEFFQLHYSERRSILLKVFQDEEQNRRVNEALAVVQRELQKRRRIDKELNEIPVRIDEARRQNKKAENKVEMELQRLRREYSDLQKALSGKCPLCGSRVEVKNKKELEQKLSELITRGKKLKAESNKPTATAEVEARVAELQEREIELGTQKTQSDKLIYEAEQAVHKAMKLLEEKVNEHFSLAKFKMFEDYKVADGVKECCEPYLNGLPYSALSKGEKFKVALDINRTLQKAYGVELPLLIDDAESYTSNSFIEVPNQVILCRVTSDEKLIVETREKGGFNWSKSK